MTIKLNSLARWKTLEANGVINFTTDTKGERRVRLHLNCEFDTTFEFQDNDGARFLVRVSTGVETIEFSTMGKCAVYPIEPEGVVQYQTAEDEPTHAVVVDPVIFTKIANRRHRNPELEEIMYRMQLNMDRRLAQQSAEIEAAFERRRREETHGRSEERVETNAPGASANAHIVKQIEQEPAQLDAGEGDGGEAGS